MSIFHSHEPRVHILSIIFQNNWEWSYLIFSFDNLLINILIQECTDV